jgi:hypothetical protein
MKTNLERHSGLDETSDTAFIKPETTGSDLHCYVRVGNRSCRLRDTTSKFHYGESRRLRNSQVRSSSAVLRGIV